MQKHSRKFSGPGLDLGQTGHVYTFLRGALFTSSAPQKSGVQPKPRPVHPACSEPNTFGKTLRKTAHVAPAHPLARIWPPSIRPRKRKPKASLAGRLFRLDLVLELSDLETCFVSQLSTQTSVYLKRPEARLYHTITGGRRREKKGEAMQ